MAAPKKYLDEWRERRDPDGGEGPPWSGHRGRTPARTAEQLGSNPETPRDGVGQAWIDEGHRPGTTTDDAQRIVELERENRDPRKANENLRTASAFFAAAELDRKTT